MVITRMIYKLSGGSDQASDPSGDLIHPCLELADHIVYQKPGTSPSLQISLTTISVVELKPNCGDKALCNQLFTFEIALTLCINIHLFYKYLISKIYKYLF